MLVCAVKPSFLLDKQKHAHPEKMAYKEEEVKQDPDTKRSVRAIAAEVEKDEGRGQMKVRNREKVPERDPHIRTAVIHTEHHMQAPDPLF